MLIKLLKLPKYRCLAIIAPIRILKKIRTYEMKEKYISQWENQYSEQINVRIEKRSKKRKVNRGRCLEYPDKFTQPSSRHKSQADQWRCWPG